ncbi:MAG: flippase-like domain-containing protein [Cyclobacteriaceae bacterium]|nr:flippase-like domain-containing protein [Cyclobacteriaceae bacterium]
MATDSKEIFRTLNLNKIWIPVLFGIAIVAYLFYSDPNVSTENLTLITDASPLLMLLAVSLIIARGFFYVYRIKFISDDQLTWGNALYVIILWEFASAVTPSVVGGTAVAVFILLKEGMSLGKSLALVMLTAILDNIIFICLAPLVFLFSQGQIIPQAQESFQVFAWSFSSQGGLQVLFWFSYWLITFYTLVMSYALLVRPRAFKWLLLKITSIRILRRWRFRAYEHGNEIMWASAQFKGKKAYFWITILATTAMIWFVRYLQLNVLIAAFVDLSLSDHFLIFGRHLILWIVMLVSPTPGSSGAAEFFFPLFFEDYLGPYTLITNISWRLLSFYPYLLLGAIVLPRWLRSRFFTRPKASED